MILRRFFLALALSAIALPALAQDGVRIIVLRHADREPRVLELNATGIARAAALPAAVADQPLDAIFVSDRKRNIDSAVPLARQRGLEIRIIEDEFLENGILAAEIVKRQPTGTSMWIGNTDNLQDLWDEMEARGSPPLRYGEISIVEFRNNAWRLIERRRFGPR